MLEEQEKTVKADKNDRLIPSHFNFRHTKLKKWVWQITQNSTRQTINMSNDADEFVVAKIELTKKRVLINIRLDAPASDEVEI